jgi:hypothetical protein
VAEHWLVAGSMVAQRLEAERREFALGLLAIFVPDVPLEPVPQRLQRRRLVMARECE